MQCKTYATHPPPHPWCQVVWANVTTARIKQFFMRDQIAFSGKRPMLIFFKLHIVCIFSSPNPNLNLSKGSGITDLTDSNRICAFSGYCMYKIQFIIDCKYTHKPTDPIALSTCHPMWTVTRILWHWTVSTAIAMTHIVYDLDSRQSKNCRGGVLYQMNLVLPKKNTSYLQNLRQITCYFMIWHVACIAHLVTGIHIACLWHFDQLCEVFLYQRYHLHRR